MEQVEEMRRLIDEKKEYFRQTYAMMERISG